MKSIRPTLERENELAAQGYKRIAGVDEAGRGPLAGPVVAAAVILPRDMEKRFPDLAARLDDSKKLKPDAREAIFDALIASVEFGIGFVDAPTIDEINIRQASWRAMRHAVADLEQRAPASSKQAFAEHGKAWDLRAMSTHVAGASDVAGLSTHEQRVNDSQTDGGVHYVLIDGLPYGDGPWPYEAIVKGDSRSLSIAAASIIAKVSRDTLMREMDALYPHYGFAQHKGYGSPQHLRALNEHGACALHRMSFSPVKNALKSRAENEQARA